MAVTISFPRIKILMGFQARLNGRATLHESRNDLQLVNLCIPTRSAIIVSRSRDTSQIEASEQQKSTWHCYYCSTDQHEIASILSALF